MTRPPVEDIHHDLMNALKGSHERKMAEQLIAYVKELEAKYANQLTRTGELLQRLREIEPGGDK